MGAIDGLHSRRQWALARLLSLAFDQQGRFDFTRRDLLANIRKLRIQVDGVCCTVFLERCDEVPDLDRGITFDPERLRAL